MADLDDLLNEVESAMTDTPDKVPSSSNFVSNGQKISHGSSNSNSSSSRSYQSNAQASAQYRQGTPFVANSSSSWKSNESDKSSKRMGGSGNELDDLLDMIEEDGPISPLKTPQPATKVGAEELSRRQPNGASSNRNQRCTFIQLTGIRAEIGLIVSSLAPRICSRMRCLNCDMNVEIFDGSEWAASVEYMFFRENHPNRARLQAGLTANPDARAFCCQCSWRAVASPTTERVTPTSDLRWVCGGHAA